jgi:hypothetical protein
VLVGIFGLVATPAYAVDTDSSYQAFNTSLFACPKAGEAGRTECVLNSAKKFTDTYCAGKGDRGACNEEWRNGYLVWFSKQPNQADLRKKIGLDPDGSAADAVPATCSDKVTDKSAKCDVAVECTNGDLSEGNCGITRYLKWFINTLSAMVGIVVIAVLVIGGIQYSTSGGDPNAAAAAKKRISNAILALVAFGLMYGFLQWLVPGGVL